MSKITRIFTVILFCTAVVSCGNHKKGGKTSADKQKNENAAVTDANNQAGGHKTISSDLCKGENCPGYIK